MATPVTLKKLEEKKMLAQKRREKQQGHLSAAYSIYPPTFPVLQPLSVTTASPLDDYKLAEKASFVPLADGAQCWTVTIRADNVMCFNGKTSFLSQLYPVSLVVDGNVYGSLEHYYQECKLISLVSAQAAKTLRSIGDPVEVMRHTRKMLSARGVRKAKVDEWKKSLGLLVTERAMRLKFGDQHPELCDKLLATGDTLLVQTIDRDAFFAAGVGEDAVREWATQNEGKVFKLPIELTSDSVKHIPLVATRGKNVLGVLAMKIRNELRNKKASIDD
uniref:NADAR domain-containing protein n=1 Tax=Globodera rostochiensis TaxID=31243 RepID=A0A914H0M4_GLORO